MARPSRSRVSSSRNQASSSAGSIFTQLNRLTACASLRALARCHAAHADSGVERSVVSGKSLTGLFRGSITGPKEGCFAAGGYLASRDPGLDSSGFSNRPAIGSGAPVSGRNSPMTYEPSASGAGLPGWNTSFPTIGPVGPMGGIQASQPSDQSAHQAYNSPNMSRAEV